MKLSSFYPQVPLLFLLLVFALLFGCSSDTSNTSENNENNEDTDVSENDNESTKEKNANEETISLSIGHFRVEDNPVDQLFAETLEKFKQEHPEVEFEENAVAHDPYRTRMTTLGASGELPDIFMANGSMLIDYISNDYVASWNDILDEDPEWSDGFINNAFDDFKSGDTVYAVPVQMQAVHTIYYNQAIFDEIGISEFPQSYNEFLDIITQLKEANYTPIVMGNKPNWPFGSTFFSTFADRITGSDWFAGLETGESAFTDPEFIEVLTKTQELAQMDTFNADINSIDPEQAAQIYLAGEAGMMVIGPWGVRDYFADAPDEIVDNTNLALLPEVNGGAGNANAVAGGGGWSYAINANLEGKEKDMAVELIKTLSDDAYAEEMLARNGMPMRPVEITNELDLSPLQMEYFELVKNAEYTPVYDIRLAPAVVESLYRGLQELLIDGVSPEQLAETIQSNME